MYYMPYLIFYASLNHCTEPPPPSRCLPGCGGPIPHHMCGSTGTCSSSDCRKLNKLMAEKTHTDPLHCYNKTGGGKEKSTERIYDEVRVGTGLIGEQQGHYQ